ncbi:MAG: 30S ribosome-binding factor RbfA [Pseudohongiellaceae bacterium]
MPKTSNRLGRIGDEICQELATLIRSELRDPRIGMVSVVGARVSRDLSHAEIYVTVLGAEVKDSVAALNHASGFLRSLLARNINLRTTPRLRFIYDETVERGRKLSALIDEAVAQDAAHHSFATEAHAAAAAATLADDGGENSPER